MRLIAHHKGELLAFREGGRVEYWLRSRNAGGPGPARCDVNDGFVHPVYGDSPPDEVAAKSTGAAVDPYDRHRKVDDGCIKINPT
ncbi:hypothetical protein HNP84_009789 [Thermocatellispora tengchongensis]|uniref:Uncharacterized protein n=1 Tax=Thermocatellispora tengchongensis TaxID=1073253 RepID=A0A840PF22_9ACTN|nr:hypothetical protein [Thermocatellispora tengchongensis]